MVLFDGKFHRYAAKPVESVQVVPKEVEAEQNKTQVEKENTKNVDNITSTEKTKEVLMMPDNLYKQEKVTDPNPVPDQTGMPDMSSLMSMGVAETFNGRNPNDYDLEKEGGDGKFHWMQKGDEVQIRCPLDTLATKKDIHVKFKPAGLTVSVRGETVIDGSLAGKIDTDDCTWCLSSDKAELQIMLTKNSDDSWQTLLA